MEVRIEENNTKNENDSKKEYLFGYQKSTRKISRLNAEIEEIRNMKMYPSMNNDGMPHGTGQNDLSDYVAKLTEMEEELHQESIEQVKLYENISQKIEQLEDENERDVLFYRYIKRKSWWEIAELMGYSERHITRIHGKALFHLKMS